MQAPPPMPRTIEEANEARPSWQPLTLLLSGVVIVMTVLNGLLDTSNVVHMAVTRDLTPTYVRLWGSEDAFDLFGRRRVVYATNSSRVAAPRTLPSADWMRAGGVVPLHADATGAWVHGRNVVFALFRWTWCSFACVTPGELLFCIASIWTTVRSLERLLGTPRLFTFLVNAFVLRLFATALIVWLAAQPSAVAHAPSVADGTRHVGDPLTEWDRRYVLSHLLVRPSAAWIAFIAFFFYENALRHSPRLWLFGWIPMGPRTGNCVIHLHLLFLSDFWLATVPSILCALFLSTSFAQRITWKLDATRLTPLLGPGRPWVFFQNSTNMRCSLRLWMAKAAQARRQAQLAGDDPEPRAAGRGPEPPGRGREPNPEEYMRLQIAMLESMGFSTAEAQAALQASRNDVAVAANNLLSGVFS